jgi:choline dehydrogenase
MLPADAADQRRPHRYRKPDFRTPPRIAPNYLSTEKDVADVVHGGRLLQAIARTRAIRALIREPIAPDLGCA